jgi:gliding motility-associated protein GldM
MAGEKLSARQKMIGMMYLVLTALLALQVSGSVLDKFFLINNSLEKSVDLKMQENTRNLEQIRIAVGEMGNRKEDVKVLNTALSVDKETTQVIRYIDSLKKELVTLAGGQDKKTGRPKGLKNDAVVARLMINHGKGNELKEILNGYMQYLTQTTGKEFPPIALNAKDSKFFRDDPNQATKDFATLNFDTTPLIAALATLSQFASDIIYAETQALAMLASSVGAQDVKFDNLAPLVKPQSNIVVAGAKYSAALFLAASSSGVDPEMTIDGQSIPVEAGVGKIEFLASPGKYNEDGLAKKVFKAAIKLKLPGGKESILTEDITYFVAKPVIQVQSAAVQALYLNCGNELNIQVPALGAAYQPSFTATGASVFPGKGKGSVTVVPEASEVSLTIYNNKNLLDTQLFKVRKMPMPTIRITSKGKALNDKLGMPAPGPRSLEVRAIADESFAAFLPKDARYRVAQWEVSLARGSRALKTKQVNSQDVDLNDFAALAKSGDRLVIEIKKVERLNFKGEIETVKIGTIIHTISLN